MQEEIESTESEDTPVIEDVSFGSSDRVSHGDDSPDEEEKARVPRPSVGTFSTVMNLVNVMVGAGILSVPSTFADNGIILGSFLLVFMAFITQISTSMTFKLQLDTDSQGFEEIANKAFGKVGDISLSVITLFFNDCALMAYLIIGTDFIISWFGAAGINANKMGYRALIAFLYSILLPGALTIPRSMTFLSYFSTAVFFCIILYTVTVMIKAIQTFKEDGINSTIIFGSMNIRFFSSISLYSLAFALPMCCLPIVYDYIADHKKRSNASGVAMIIACLLTLIPSIFVYLDFGSSCTGDAMKNYSDKDTLMIVVRVGFFIVVSCSYPITAPCVAAPFSELIYHENNPADLKNSKRAFILFLTNVIPIVIAMFLPEMTPALEIGGSLGGCLGNYTYPGLLWIWYSPLKWYHWKNLHALFLIVFGVICAIISCYTGVVSAIDAFKTLY